MLQNARIIPLIVSELLRGKRTRRGKLPPPPPTTHTHTQIRVKLKAVEAVS